MSSMTIEMNLAETLELNGLNDRDYNYERGERVCAHCGEYIYNADDWDDYYHLCVDCKIELSNIFILFCGIFNKYELKYLDEQVEGTSLFELAGRPEA